MKRLLRGMVCSLAAATVLFAMAAAGQQGSGSDSGMGNMPGMNMPGAHQSGAAASSAENDLSNTEESMAEPHHMDMSPHMHMTELRPAQPGDEARAQQIVTELRQSIEKYKDYRAALADGYQVHHPNTPTKMKHFTNFRYAMEAAYRFDAVHPTSLLYQKEGSGYKLIGAMYTAPQRFTEDQLDQRVPLSVAQWHQHVNLCMPPKGKRGEGFGKNPQFGFGGSIATQEACDAAGGTWKPRVFGWMVHVYPFEKTQAEIWSVEMQGSGKHQD